MIHPLEGDLSQLKDSDIEERVVELNRKYFLAYRLGKPELLTQIATFATIYKEELARRYAEKTKAARNQMDGDLDQLINVD